MSFINLLFPERIF